MPKEILGKGWQFPITLDQADAVAISRYEEKIKQSIHIILGTAKGERVMRPTFGCNIHDYIFAVINATTLNRIKSAVREALILWEPRIEVLRIQSSTRNANRGVIDVEINYKVRYTNTAFNLVYPVYLDSSGNES